MKSVQLGDFFSRGKVAEFLDYQLTFAEPQQTEQMAKSLHLSFEDAVHTLGLQENDPVRWIVSPGTLLLSGLPGDPAYPHGWAQSVGLYASAFIRPRQDNQVVIYSKGHELPVHVTFDQLEPSIQDWGTSKGLLKGIIYSLLSEGRTIQGFDGFIDSPMEPGSGFSSSAVFSGLVIHSLLTNSEDFEYKQLSSILPLTDKYIRAEKDFFGSLTSGLPLLTTIVGGSIITSTFGIQIFNQISPDTSDSSSWGYYIQNLPIPQELDLQSDFHTKNHVSFLELSKPRPKACKEFDPVLEIDKVLQSRNGWYLNRENIAYLRAIRAIQNHSCSASMFCIPYASSSRELRQVLTLSPRLETLVQGNLTKKSDYRTLYPGILVSSENQGTRDLNPIM
jgi:hypothetical protein